MSTAALSVPSSAQIEGANFLNLLIVDDERAIREVCRDVAQSLGFNTVVADSRGACVSDVRDAEHRCGAARPYVQRKADVFSGNRPTRGKVRTL